MKRKLPIFYSAMLLTAVNLLLRMVSTSFQVYISARIGASGVGLLQLVMSVGSLALTAGMAGVRTATMYLTAEQLGKKQPGSVVWVLSGCFLYSLLCSTCIALLLYCFAPYLAQNWIGKPETLHALRLFAIFLPLTCLCGCMTGYFTAANRIGTLAIVEIGEQLCYMAVTMGALHFWAGNDPAHACEAVVFGSGFSACFTLVVLAILRLLEWQKHTKQIPVRARLLSTAIPLALADDVKAGISTTENLMVPKRLALYPGELTPLATFGMVCGMVFPVMMFPAAILFALAELLIPELARCNAAGSTHRIRYLVKRSLRIALLYGSLCCGILFLTAKPLCMELYGDSAAAGYLRMYSLLVPMLYCDAVTDAMTKGLGQQKICVRNNIITSAMDVALLFLLLPRFGMHGYFFSFFITHLINFLLSLFLLQRITKLRIPFYIPALTCAAMVIAIYLAGLLPGTVSRIIAFPAISVSLLTLFGIVSTADIRWVKGLIKRN